MQWEELTATDFARAVRETGVCVLPLGVLEKHSEHLPLGTDYLAAHRVACLAAEQEPAVVFPPFYFGQIYEARCFPGALTLKPTLLLELLQGVLDEIGRNGFTKIVLYNGHGGNTHFLSFLAQCSLWEKKTYSLYMPMRPLTPEGEKEWRALLESEFGEHAGETETSLMLGTYAHLVKLERIPEKPGAPLGRLGHLPRTMTGIWWYGDYPQHYAGDARPATPEKGQVLTRLMVEALAHYLAAVKADETVPALEQEFFRHERHLGRTVPADEGPAQPTKQAGTG
jgi:creatinine amidohydrolase